MKIEELKDKQGGINAEVKVIYDKMPEKEMFGKRTKTLVVVDADVEKGGTSALLDVYGEDIDKFKFGDKLKVVNCYAKEITTSKGKQKLITYGFKDGELVGHYEKIN